MKKTILVLIAITGILSAQVVSQLQGVPNHTMVYQSGGNTKADLDTANGLKINSLSIHSTGNHGLLKVDTINIGVGGTVFGSNGAGFTAQNNLYWDVNGHLTSNSWIYAPDSIKSGLFKGGIFSGSTGVFTGTISAKDIVIGDTLTIDGPIFMNAGPVFAPALATDAGGQIVTATTVGTGAVVLQSYVDGIGASACAGAYNSGTTYAVNAGVSYLGLVYISNVSSNTGHTPDSSPTQWTAYSYCIDAVSYILNNAVFHP